MFLSLLLIFISNFTIIEYLLYVIQFASNNLIIHNNQLKQNLQTALIFIISQFHLLQPHHSHTSINKMGNNNQYSHKALPQKLSSVSNSKSISLKNNEQSITKFKDLNFRVGSNEKLSQVGYNFGQPKVEIDQQRLLRVKLKYGKKLSKYFPVLYEKLPKSVMLWKCDEMPEFLSVIGMAQNFTQYFLQRSIDGSCVYLLDIKDLIAELEMKSTITIAYFMAWVDQGFNEYQKYVQNQNDEKKYNTQKLIENIECISYISAMQNSIKQMIKQQSIQKLNIQISICLPELNSIKQKQYSQNWEGRQRYRETQQVQGRQTRKISYRNNEAKLKNRQEKVRLQNKLQIIDEETNICLEVKQFPCFLADSIDQIYKQNSLYGIRNRRQKRNNKIQLKSRGYDYMDSKHQQKRQRQVKRQYKNYGYLKNQFKNNTYIQNGKKCRITNLQMEQIQIMIARKQNQINGRHKYYLALVQISQRWEQKSIEKQLLNISEDELEMIKILNQMTKKQHKQPTLPIKNKKQYINLTDKLQYNINAYINIQQPLQIPQKQNNKIHIDTQSNTKTNSNSNTKQNKSADKYVMTSVKQYKENENMLLSPVKDNNKEFKCLQQEEDSQVFNFIVNQYTFIPAFLPTQTVNKNQQKQLCLILQVLQTKQILQICPISEKFEKSPKNCQLLYSQPQCQLFFICYENHKNRLKIRQPPLFLPVLQWMAIQGYNHSQQFIATIIYIKQQKKFYIFNPVNNCKQNVGLLTSFVNRKLNANCRQANQQKQIEQALKPEEQGRWCGKKSKGRRRKRQQQRQQQQKNDGNKDRQEQADKIWKYSSNRQQYINSQSTNAPYLYNGMPVQIWYKLPVLHITSMLQQQARHQQNSTGQNKDTNIYKSFNNLITMFNSHQSFQISKQTKLKIGSRQLSLNICSTVYRQGSNWCNHYHEYGENSAMRVQAQTQAYGNKCIICCERDTDCLYLECRHNVTCMHCGKMLDTCPYCRRAITDYVRLYHQ